MSIQLIQELPHTTAEAVMGYSISSDVITQGAYCVLNRSFANGGSPCGEEQLFIAKADGSLEEMPAEQAEKLDLQFMISRYVFTGASGLTKHIPIPSFPIPIAQWLKAQKEVGKANDVSEFFCMVDMFGHFISFIMGSYIVVSELNADAEILHQKSFYKDVIRMIYLNQQGNLCFFTETDFSLDSNFGQDSVINVYRIE